MVTKIMVKRTISIFSTSHDFRKKYKFEWKRNAFSDFLDQEKIKLVKNNELIFF